MLFYKQAYKFEAFTFYCDFKSPSILGEGFSPPVPKMAGMGKFSGITSLVTANHNLM
ncbi:MAG: hypothetical protein IPL55_11785 [Saprospiraceae bacterium]|nr:hypothetical protein [Saprospiraceae bacterium]